MTVTFDFFRPIQIHYGASREPTHIERIGLRLALAVHQNESTNKESNLATDIAQTIGIATSILCNYISKARSLSKCLGMQHSIIETKTGVCKFLAIDMIARVGIQFIGLWNNSIIETGIPSYCWYTFGVLNFCYGGRLNLNWNSVIAIVPTFAVFLMEASLYKMVYDTITTWIGQSNTESEKPLYKQITLEILTIQVSSFILAPFQVLLTALIIKGGKGLNVFHGSLGISWAKLGWSMLSEFGYRTLVYLATSELIWLSL